MNAIKNKIADKPISKEIHDMKHLLKVLIKDNREIKSHLWLQTENKPKKLDSDKSKELVKSEAINYINNVVVPELEAHKVEKGEIGAQGIQDWFIAQLAQPVFNWLKTQALQYIGDALTELKQKAIPLAVEACDWLLDKLEDFIVDKFKETDESDKEAFKEAIKEHFPNSRLLGKL
jgi:hypothetical protein